MLAAVNIEIMNIEQIFNYAKDKGEEIDFEFTNLKGEVVKCRTLDAWFGFFKLGDNEGFVTQRQWKDLTGDCFDFRVLSA